MQRNETLLFPLTVVVSVCLKGDDQNHSILKTTNHPGERENSVNVFCLSCEASVSVCNTLRFFTLLYSTTPFRRNHPIGWTSSTNGNGLQD